MSTKNVTNIKKKTGKKRKKKTNHVGIICASLLGVFVVATVGAYGVGRLYYNNRFLSNTTINGVDVSRMNFDEACKALGESELPSLNVEAVDGKLSFDLNDINFTSNSKDEIKKALDGVNHNLWFSGLSQKSSFAYGKVIDYDADKLKDVLRNAQWGDTKTSNAKIKIEKDKCELVKEVQGNKVTDMDKLYSYVKGQLDAGVYDIKLSKSVGCYKIPEITADSLKSKYENVKKVFNMSITYDFDYTTEKLSGKTLTDLLDFDDDGNYTVDRDKAMKYVEKLGKKYDTYNTKRTFKSTKQGKIVIPTSSDARYGWWIDQEKTCDALVKMLEEGKTVKKVDPVYYKDGGFEYTGVEKARSKDDDIGKTYVEVDLSRQHLWYYKDGKLKYNCDIVSGQTTSAARTTLPGVYKIWYKATNYRMKDSNSDGDTWDTTCYYWNSVSPVGIGLHDSTWRWAFGGTVYQYNGSHGCINMPLDGAKYIYNNVPIGTPVVMYYKSAKK